MKQITQKLKNGEMSVHELPIPLVGKRSVLVKNHYSVLSPGTEGSTVTAARKNLIAKAHERPRQAMQVLDVLKTQGIVQTYRTVMKKLDAYSPLGYSCAGEVIEVGEEVKEFKVGDRVACAGLTACHAEVVSVPVNLCVKLKDDDDLSLACYNTLGAIAMQSVRQADLRLGETCAVIGLGLVGQLVSLQLRASGVRVVGIDINPAVVDIARSHCCDIAFVRNQAGLQDTITSYTNGLGVDAVIIAADTDSLDPINLAGALCRKRGRVVILGSVPTGFDRDPYYYRKELELKMSCSYGPGRYDFEYEEKGIDYPAAYVRWTEKRNMEAFQELIRSHKIDISYLTTHTFDLDDACQAYDLVTNRTEPFLGILLKYDITKNHKNASIQVKTDGAPLTNVTIAFIGAGSYAQGMLLPSLPSNITRKGVMTASGTTSKRIAERFDFGFCTNDETDILDNKEINTLFVSTRHDTHAEYVIKGLLCGKNVYVDKPLCLNIDDLLRIKQLCENSDRSLMVGYNRRFSPLTDVVKKHVGEGCMSMVYRINAGKIPADSWIHDINVGGGRIIGEVCHFIDYMTYICGTLPVSVSAMAMEDPEGFNDTVNIMVQFSNGSSGVVCYYSNGSKSLPKEYIEIYSSGTTAIIDDFKTCKIYSNGKTSSHRLTVQDKGQKQMLKLYFDSLRNGKQLIPTDQLFAVTAATFAAVKSIQEGGTAVRITIL